MRHPASVSVTFDPKDYFLTKSDAESNGEYMLVHRINRNYKGKDDEEGMAVFYFQEKDAEMFRKAGFIEIL